MYYHSWVSMLLQIASEVVLDRKICGCDPLLVRSPTGLELIILLAISRVAGVSW